MAQQCGCLGGNENCTFCYGSGYIDRPYSRATQTGCPPRPGGGTGGQAPVLGSVRPELPHRGRMTSFGGSTIPISDLARELAVNPNVILDLLPQLGVSDRKIRSSPLEEDVAVAVRRALGGLAKGAPPAASRPPNVFARQTPFTPPPRRPGAETNARARALATGRGQCGPAETGGNPAWASEVENYWVERRRDGSRDYWQFRETGRFGSHPTYDDCGDESAP